MRRRFRSRERIEWVQANQVVPVSVAINTVSTNGLITNAQLEEFPNSRLMRVVGTIFVSPATAPAAASGYGVFLGLCRQSSVQATPARDPEVHTEFRWPWWQACFPQIGGTAAADSNAARWVGYFRIDIVQRFRLRFGAEDQLQLQVKNSAQSSAAIQFSYAMRFELALGRR